MVVKMALSDLPGMYTGLSVLLETSMYVKMALFDLS